MSSHDSHEARRMTAAGLADVTRSFGEVKALRSVSLTILPGATVLLGRNGAGKSTMSRILAGLDKPDGGRVVSNGQPLKAAEDWRLHHSRTGWLPQTLDVPMAMTVEQYLRYAAWLKCVPKREVGDAIDLAIRRVDLVDQRRRRLGQLSGGMIRRAGIAQAIVHNPSLVILDEPTVGLDPEQRARFHEIISELSADRSLFISTHLLEDVEAIADSVVVLEQGQVRFEGTMGQLQSLSPSPTDSAQARLRSGFLRIVADGE